MQRALALFATVWATSTPAAADEFWAHWGDGKAELDGYALVEPRYGERRDGTAVMIYVTEDFSDSARVKADPGKHPASDVHPVLKLNFVRDFQTGIYDYNTLTSTFVRTEFGGGEFWPLDKASFSSQEWCGHVYMQWLPRAGKLVGTSHSYFDGEADATAELPFPVGGVVEDALPILVRGLRGDWLQPGATKKVPFLRSQIRTRLLHLPAAWGEATVSRARESAPVKSALGTLSATTYTVVEASGDTIAFTVEEAAPHRLLAWKSSSGEAGKILGSARLPYWQLHDNASEKLLERLGIPPQSRPKR
jgi:hypothetical protein